jgi:membrane protein implicated in regulation of membrane protease activity
MKFFNLKNPWMWASFCVALSVVFGFIFKFTGISWTYYAAFFTWIPIVLFIVVGIVFAWIINPIRRLREKRKNKEE